MAALSPPKRVTLGLAALLLIVVGAGLVWRVARAPDEPTGLSAVGDETDGSPGSGRHTSHLGDRRLAAADRGAASAAATDPDPAWDADTVALWRTVQDSALDDIVRESAALKLASRGDRGILAKLWDLWRQGRLPAGCSWLRDLVADSAAGGSGAGSEERPSVPVAEVAKAAARAVNAALPLEARLDAVRVLASAQTDEALAILQGLAAGEISAPAELRTAAFSALLQVDAQSALAALNQRLGQTPSPAATELVEMLEALADEPRPGVRDIALPLLQHADADVREEAAWLLAVNSDETTAEDMRTILQLLGTEDEAAVRRRLYAALDEGAVPYADGVLAALRAEESMAVRLSGYQALAGMTMADTAGHVGQIFDAQVVGELTDTALNASEYQYRFESVVVLKSARTAGAAAALARIAAEASDSRIA